MQGDKYRFELCNGGMDFIITNFKFHGDDIYDYYPIVKSIIYKKDLDKIEHKVIGSRILEFDNKGIREKVAKETILKLNKEIEIREEMMSNPDYIEWLCVFTKKCGGYFNEDTWDYEPDKISDFDRKNVNNLSIFFEGINKYAEDNNIPYKRIPFGGTYFIKYNDADLEIGFIVGQGSLAFSRIINNEENFISNFIDFNQVLNKNGGKCKTKKI